MSPLTTSKSRGLLDALPFLRMASAIGPSWDGPEYISASRIAWVLEESILATNLKILGMALARVLDFGVSSPLVWQKLAMSPNVGKKCLDSNRFANSTTIGLLPKGMSNFVTYSIADNLGLRPVDFAGKAPEEWSLRKPGCPS